MTYRELIYMISDIVKLDSDDASFNEAHIAFLLNRYRSNLLYQYYKKKTKHIPLQNYQTICLDVEPYKETDSNCSPIHLRSIQEVPKVMDLTDIKVTTLNSLDSTLSYVPLEQYQYANANIWTKNILYATKHYDNHIYIKSSNPQFTNLKKIKVQGIFEDPASVSALSCDSDGNSTSCEWMDAEFPIEDLLSSILIETVVKILQPSTYMPADNINNAKDNLTDNLAPSSKNTTYSPRDTTYRTPRSTKNSNNTTTYSDEE